MSLKAAYEAELKRREDSEAAASAPREDGLRRLRDFHQALMADADFFEELNAEVELFEDELRIDPGNIMITVRPAQTGFRVVYEVKRPDDYAEVEVPGIDTAEQLEAAIARLMVEHR